MQLTKRQLRRIIREAIASTEKYDDDSALRGNQSKLPDALQKGIIDKTVEDREAYEEEKKNEAFRITRSRFKRIIREILQDQGSKEELEEEEVLQGEEEEIWKMNEKILSLIEEGEPDQAYILFEQIVSIYGDEMILDIISDLQNLYEEAAEISRRTTVRKGALQPTRNPTEFLKKVVPFITGYEYEPFGGPGSHFGTAPSLWEEQLRQRLAGDQPSGY